MGRTLGEDAAVERRVSPRRRCHEVSWLSAARLRPGHVIEIVNVSAGGALIEAGVQLLPGTRVTLQFLGPSVCIPAAARVLRCHVAALDPERGIRYRGALAFEEEFDLLWEEPGDAG